ncbi:hypothetical protein QQS21_012367 [Conoideocrella luteorostrata]|uniref:DUF7708 domain-containing protein n=1 Tax=Conoideocrella luteorostrata TaxID=1105319 RepID=A0AAJ0CBB8_9HYPO|nr:hypothetical protein QQS21_012367 [Conoideocrella luteorostrata]
MSFGAFFPGTAGSQGKAGSILSTSSNVSMVRPIFKTVLDEYTQKFTDEEIDVIVRTSSLKEFIENLQQDIPSPSKKRSRLADITSGLERYGDIFAVIGAASPELSTVLWGSLELIYKRQKSSDSKDVQEAMIDMLHEFCTVAPRLQSYEAIFGELSKPEIIQTSLVDVFRAILDFFYEVNQWIKSCSKGILQHGPKPQPTLVRSSIEKVRTAKRVLEEEVSVASLTLHRGWQLEIREMLAKVTTQPAASLPCRNIPYPRNPKFVGRTKIMQKMESCLAMDTGEDSDQASFALHGIGGVGKTQIALQYIYDHLNDYPAIFWVAADSHVKLSQSYVAAAKQLQIEPPDSTRDPDTIVRLFKSWLGECHGRWIMVFDNADNLEVLKDFWPPSKTGSIVITSRDSAPFLWRSRALRCFR